MHKDKRVGSVGIAFGLMLTMIAGRRGTARHERTDHQYHDPMSYMQWVKERRGDR